MEPTTSNVTPLHPEPNPVVGQFFMPTWFVSYLSAIEAIGADDVALGLSDEEYHERINELDRRYLAELMRHDLVRLHWDEPDAGTAAEPQDGEEEMDVLAAGKLRRDRTGSDVPLLTFPAAGTGPTSR
jgi:hypothetical protein